MEPWSWPFGAGVRCPGIGPDSLAKLAPVGRPLSVGFVLFRRRGSPPSRGPGPGLAGGVRSGITPACDRGWNPGICRGFLGHRGSFTGFPTRAQESQGGPGRSLSLTRHGPPVRCQLRQRTTPSRHRAALPVQTTVAMVDNAGPILWAPWVLQLPWECPSPGLRSPEPCPRAPSWMRSAAPY